MSNHKAFLGGSR